MGRGTRSDEGLRQVRITDVGAPAADAELVDVPEDGDGRGRSGVVALAGLIVIGLVAIWVAAYTGSTQRTASESTTTSTPPTSTSVSTTTTTVAPTSTSVDEPSTPTTTTIVGDGWQAVLAPRAFWLREVVEFRGAFVGIGFVNSGFPTLMHSADGLHWSTVSTDVPEGFPVALRVAGSGVDFLELVIVGGDSAELVERWRSSDRRTWELHQSVETGLTDIRGAVFSGDSLLAVGRVAGPALEPIDGANDYLADRVGVVIDERICDVRREFLTLPENEGKAGFSFVSCDGVVLAELERNTELPPEVDGCLNDVVSARPEAVSVADPAGVVEMHTLARFGSVAPPVAIDGGFVVSWLGGRNAFEAAKGPCFGFADPMIWLYRPGQAGTRLDPGPFPEDPDPVLRIDGWFVDALADGSLVVRDSGSPTRQPVIRRSAPPYVDWDDVDPEAGLPSLDGKFLIRAGPQGLSVELSRVLDREGQRWTNIPLAFPLFADAEHAFVMMQFEGRDYLVKVPVP